MMQRIANQLYCLQRDESGQGLVEYLLILALVAWIVIKLVFSIVAAVFWIVLVIVAIAAVLWAINTLF